MELGRCVEDEPPVAVDLPDTEVAHPTRDRTTSCRSRCVMLERRLLGIVTVDDVLDRSLPVGWRQRLRETSG